jgi:hypothetical protein
MCAVALARRQIELYGFEEAGKLLRGTIVRWALAGVLPTAIASSSGCQHVSPLWPLKTDAETGAVCAG